MHDVSVSFEMSFSQAREVFSLIEASKANATVCDFDALVNLAIAVDRIIECMRRSRHHMPPMDSPAGDLLCRLADLKTMQESIK